MRKSCLRGGVKRASCIVKVMVNGDPSSLERYLVLCWVGALGFVHQVSVEMEMQQNQ